MRQPCSTQCLAERHDRGHEYTAARDLSGLGTALLNLGDLPRARTLLEESLVVARRFDDRWSSAMSLTLLGHLRLAEGDPDRAQAELAEAAALFAATGNLVYLPWCLEALAGVAVARSELHPGRRARRRPRCTAGPDRRAGAAGPPCCLRADAGRGTVRPR